MGVWLNKMQALENQIKISEGNVFSDEPNGIIWASEGNQIQLPYNRYLFPQDRLVKVVQGNEDLQLNASSRQLIGQMLTKDEISLNEALETIGKAINDSYRYDIVGAVKLVRGKALSLRNCLGGELDDGSFQFAMTDARQFARNSRNYSPKGDETLFGYCKHAGDDIRRLLQIYFSDPNLKIGEMGSRPLRVVGHDSTLIFDIETSNWSIINSKSTSRFYNTVPYERLSNFIDVFVKRR